MRILPLLATLTLAGCASQPVPDATGSLDWSEVAEEQVPVLVTRDADGDPRVTKMWLAVVDGSGYVRTSETRWSANLQRNPDAVLRIGGAAHGVRAAPVDEATLRSAIDQAFREKYGFQDRMSGWFIDRSEATIWRLEPR